MHFSLEAEQSVLGACMGWPEAYPRIQGQLEAGAFYREDHRTIWSAITAVADKGLDPVTVAEHLQAAGQLDSVGGLSNVVALVENCPGAANVEVYAQIVREHALRRRLAEMCAGIVERLREPPQTLIADLQSALDAVQHSGHGEALSFLEVLSRADDVIHEARRAAEQGGHSGIPTGLPALDRRIGGLPRKRLIILAGRPSLGKTALSEQIALHAARHGHPVGFCSLEMGADELGIRAFANVLEVNGTALQYGERHTVEAWSRKLSGHPMLNYPIFVDDFTFTLGGIVARAHEWRHRQKIELLIVDYLGLIEGAPGERKVEQLGEITRTMKKLAKRLDLPVLLLAQLNRKVEEERRRPKLSDLRDSGAIEQDADVAIFLHSDDDSEEEGPVSVEIGVLKTRYGKRGWLPARFQFDGRTQRFMETVPGFEVAA